MYNAYITKIKNVRKHSNADRLNVGECFGNQVIVGLDVKEDEMGIYFPTDGQLDIEFLKANDLLAYTDPVTNERKGGYFEEKGRVKTMKSKTTKSIVILIITIFLTGISSAQGRELPPELENIKISRDFVPSQVEAVGTVSELKPAGGLIILKRASGIAYYAVEGDPVHENDALYTLESRCRLEFRDKNVLLMAPVTHIDIDEIETDAGQGKKSASFSTNRGKVIIYAIRLFRYREVILNLKTVTAVIGIRGTKFGTEIEEVNPNSTTDGQRLMLAGPTSSGMAAGKGGGDVITRVYVFEGEVSVTSRVDGHIQRLRENEIIIADQIGLGEIRLDPTRTRAFMEEVITGRTSSPELPRLDQPDLKDQIEDREKIDEIRQRAREPHPVKEPEDRHPH